MTINNLENSLCQEMIPVFHLKKYGDRKLKCFGIIPVTPQKANSEREPADVTQRQGGPSGTPSTGEPHMEGG